MGDTTASVTREIGEFGGPPGINNEVLPIVGIGVVVYFVLLTVLWIKTKLGKHKEPS